MNTPSSKQFRIDELNAIQADTDALIKRITDHRDYLADPVYAETHRADCPNNDVVVANLTLAAGAISGTKRHFGIAMKLTDTPDPVQSAPEVIQPDPETP